MKTRLRIFVCLSFLFIAASAPCPRAHGAPSLHERWHCDLASASRSLPVVLDADGNGALEIQLTTCFDGALWQIAPDGAIIGQYPRANWLEGSLAVSRPAPTQHRTVPLLAFQESTGHLNVLDMRRGQNLWLPIEGECAAGSGPCFADLNGDGLDELICARRNGIVTAFDQQLSPLWQFDSGASFESTPCAAPVFEGMGAVYVQSTDGMIYGLSGLGIPLWRYKTRFPAPSFPSFSDVLVVQLGDGRPSVLASDAEGWLYAIDAISGAEQWRVRAGTSPLGSPALIRAESPASSRLLLLSEQGELTIISAEGKLLQQRRLPSGTSYVPRPLVADVDGDGEPEVLAALNDWAFVIASLDGAIQERIPLQGNATEGLVLADLDTPSGTPDSTATPNNTLELLIATDCGRLYCFTTAAAPTAQGWFHPQANPSLNGNTEGLLPSPVPSILPRSSKSVEPRSVVTPSFVKARPFGAALLDLGKWAGRHTARAVVRRGATVLGSTFKPIIDDAFIVPYVCLSPDQLALDMDLFDHDGDCIASITGVQIEPQSPQPIRLASPDEFTQALAELGNAYASLSTPTPPAWALPSVSGRDTWHVTRFAPEQYAAYGLAEEPFIADSLPSVWAPAGSIAALLTPAHKTWRPLENDAKPFFVENESGAAPGAPYPEEAFQRLADMGGERFLGFPVREWALRLSADGTWERSSSSDNETPKSREQATSLLKADFDALIEHTHGRIYEGQGYSLFHHQAFAWGAPMGFAQVGADIPCAPLQFAFLRGAARQCANTPVPNAVANAANAPIGGRPWGICISNRFRGAVVDTRFSEHADPVRWSPPSTNLSPGNATGLFCGHSASLEFRLRMAAHLAGAAFIQHESDTQNGSIFVKEDAPGSYSPSLFGEGVKTWFAFTKQYPNRGVPYTPFAFLLDFNHAWTPRQDIRGMPPPESPGLSIARVFDLVFPQGQRLDFERGYLTNGPYGDSFDVLTNDAPLAALQPYAVLWPLGGLTVSSALQQTLMAYVRAGGILVLDASLAESFPARFLGVNLGRDTRYAAHIQTPLQSTLPPLAPYRYRRLDLARDAEPLAWSGGGDPILAWKRIGRGIVVTSGACHWLDERQNLLPLAGALLESFASAFLPVRASADVEMFISKTESSWLVGLINNDGVTKAPVRPPSIDMRKTRECVLRFRDRTPLQFIARMGDFEWSNQANGIETKLPPGSVAVVELKYAP